MHSRIIVIVIVATASLVVSCGRNVTIEKVEAQTDTPGIPPDTNQTIPEERLKTRWFDIATTTEVARDEKVDLLFAVDHSASMSDTVEDETGALNQFFSQFTESYLPKLSDICVGVITPDFYETSLNSPKLTSQTHTCSSDGSSTPLKDRVWRAFQQKPSVALAWEAPYASVKAFLEINEQPGSSHRLFRSRSRRGLIFLSDEAEGSPMINQMADELLATNNARQYETDADGIGRQLRAFFNDLDGTDSSGNFYVGAVVDPDVDQNGEVDPFDVVDQYDRIIFTWPGGPQAPLEKQYLTLVDSVGDGSFYRDIHSDLGTNVFSAVGDALLESTFIEEFDLGAIPVPKSVNVRIYDSGRDLLIADVTQFRLLGSKILVDREIIRRYPVDAQLRIIFEPQN